MLIHTNAENKDSLVDLNNQQQTKKSFEYFFVLDFGFLLLFCSLWKFSEELN